MDNSPPDPSADTLTRDIIGAGIEVHRLLDDGYRIDLIVDRAVIVEVKAVESLHPVISAQVLTYMKLSGLQRGLVCNFHVHLFKDGVKRLVL